MGNLANHQRIGGEGVHIADCYVWAEIYYLDSSTDYREYLPQHQDKEPPTTLLDDWVLLEFSERSPRRRAERLAGLIFLFVVLIFGLISYA